MSPATTRMLIAGVAIAGAWGLGSPGLGEGQETPQVVKTARGGLLVKTPRHQFEVFFFPTGVRVLSKTAAGQPVDLAGATGTATFYHPNSPRPWFSRPLRASGGTLDLAIGLGNAPASGAIVTIQVAGLADASEPAATFTVPLAFVPQPTAQPAPPPAGVAAVPRYTYGPGSSGYGYYPYSSPVAAAPPASAYHGYATPSRHFRADGDSVGPGHRDWSTGRDLPLAKPWMRPID